MNKALLPLFIIILACCFIGCEFLLGIILNYTVTFDLDGGTIDGDASPLEISVPKGQTIEKLPKFPKDGNNSCFGWFTQKLGRGDEFFSNTPVESNMTVYAKWSFYGPKSITLTGLKPYEKKYGYVVISHTGNIIASSDLNNGERITSESFTAALWENVNWVMGGRWSGSQPYNSFPCTIDLYISEFSSLSVGAGKNYDARIQLLEPYVYFCKEITAVHYGDYAWYNWEKN